MRPFFQKLLLFLNASAGLLLLISSYSFLINPAQWWLPATAGLIFPVLLAANLFFLPVWLVVNYRRLWIPLLALVLSTPAFLRSYGMNSTNEAFGMSKSDSVLRVMSWNVGLMNLNARDTNEAIIGNRLILDAIAEHKPDVVCLQEFLTALQPNGHYNFLDSLKRTQGFAYHYFAVDYDVYEGFFVSGSLVLSRYPITDSSTYPFPGPFGGSAIRTGIAFRGDTIDVFTSRLQSLNFKRNEYAVFSKLKQGSPAAVKGSRTLFRKVKYAYQQRAPQVATITREMERSNRMRLFTGDLNDIPTGYAYHKIKGNMKDAWLKTGLGWGRTFRKISRTLRIDFIFYSPQFELLQCRRVRNTGSDHYGLVADLKIQE